MMTVFLLSTIMILLSSFESVEPKGELDQRIFYAMPFYRYNLPPGRGDDLGTYPCQSVQHGTLICLSVKHCSSFVFKNGLNPSCKLYSILPEDGLSLEHNTDYQIYYSLEDHKHNWILVFESKAYNGRSPYKLYNSPLSGVWKAPNNYSLGVFKSSLIENWASLHVEKVKFILEQDGQTAVSMVFDGKHSNKMNWFSQERLIEAMPWTDIKTKKPIMFSIIGEDTVYKRRFYINENYDHCKHDRGWLLIRDDRKGMACKFDARKFPIFIFSPGKAATYLKYFEFADKMLISIKVR